jgi:mannose-1-phosphate guanylyltransferase
VVGAGAVIHRGARVLSSVLMDRAEVGPDAQVCCSVLGAGAQVGSRAVLHGAVIGDSAVVGARCELRDGLRVWPGVVLPDGGIRFSADV